MGAPSTAMTAAAALMSGNEAFAEPATAGACSAGIDADAMCPREREEESAVAEAARPMPCVDVVEAGTVECDDEARGGGFALRGRMPESCAATSNRAAELPRGSDANEAGRKSIWVEPLSIGSRWLAGTSIDGALAGLPLPPPPPLSWRPIWCRGGIASMGERRPDLTGTVEGR